MTHSLYRPSLGGAPLLTSSFIMWKRCPASGRGRVEQRQTGSGRTFAAINSPPALSSEATRVTREREGRAGPLFTPISNRCFPTPTSKKSLKPLRCCLIFACRIGMAILKDAIFAVVAIIGAKGLGWAWYILGLPWFGQ